MSQAHHLTVLSIGATLAGKRHSLRQLVQTTRALGRDRSVKKHLPPICSLSKCNKCRSLTMISRVELISPSQIQAMYYQMAPNGTTSLSRLTTLNSSILDIHASILPSRKKRSLFRLRGQAEVPPIAKTTQSLMMTMNRRQKSLGCTKTPVKTT